MPRFISLLTCVLVGILAASPLVRADSFTRITDTNSPVPGMGVNFTALGGFTELNGHEALFWGEWGPAGSPAQGLFLYNNGVISEVADTTTQRPDGPGTFGNFNGYSFDGANVVFVDYHGAKGLYNYSLSDHTLSTLANQQTTVSSATGTVTGTLENLFIPSASGGKVAFNGQILTFGPGIFSNVSGSFRAVVDQTTPAPGHPGDLLLAFAPPSLRGNKIAFAGQFGTSTQSLQQGIYVADATTGGVTRVADVTTQRPGGGTWNGFSDEPGFDGTNLSIIDVNAGLYTTIGGTLRAAADTSTLIPGTATHLGTFLDSSLDGERIAFTASTGPGAVPGLFLWDDGTISQILAPGGVLDGKSISGLALGVNGLSGDNLAFEAHFVDGSSGIYVTSIPEPSVGIFLVTGSIALMARRPRV